MTDVLNRAREFMLCNARLLERRQFEAIFDRGSVEGVVTALAAFQNADGGFGCGLEPDKRDPASQPVDLQIALEALESVGASPMAMVLRACDWMSNALESEGGLPYALPSLNAYPHAPWWAVATGPLVSNLNPTAAVVGQLLRMGVDHPVVGRGSTFCWAAIGAATSADFHEVKPILTFLEHAQDRLKSRDEIARVIQRVGQPGVVALDPEAVGYVQMPLDFAPSPSSACHVLFSSAVLDQHLDALAARQQEDGGWPLNWETVGAGAALEARGMRTLKALRTLSAYGRL